MKHAPLCLLLLLLAAAPACGGPSQQNRAGAEGAADPPSAQAAPHQDPLAPPADVAAPPADAARTPSGLASKVLRAGTGTTRPGPRAKVLVHYTGWTTDGRAFDSSHSRHQPARFPLDGVIKGWSEGVQLMVTGEKRRLWMPAELAYGDPPTRAGAPAGMLVFDVELLEFQEPTPPPTAPAGPTRSDPLAAPADVGAPPADALRTASGLAYKHLRRGDGARRPGPRDRVTVHYTGWTTDGQRFDSSVQRGRPATFPLDGVIPGWTEGLQLMVVGDRVRFWIPAQLAYGHTPRRPGAPAGMLVFDVELLALP